MSFSLTGFTNPTSQDTAYFEWASFAIVDGTTYPIDEYTLLGVEFASGTCTFDDAFPTDGDNRIYAIPENYTFNATCDFEIGTDYTLELVFPDDFTIKDDYRCTLGGLEDWSLNTRYICDSNWETKTITILNFASDPIQSEKMFDWTVDNIINPGTFG